METKMIKDMLNVKDFGAVGDGVTYDGEAFKNVLAYAAAQEGGFVLYVPPGKYNLIPPDGK